MAEQEERKRLLARAQTLSRELSALEEAASRAYEPEERKWRVADVVEAVSKGGATLAAQKDGAVAVSENAAGRLDVSLFQPRKKMARWPSAKRLHRKMTTA